MIVILLFVVIACMRVVQSVCGKRASNEVRNNKTFFLYGIYYETLAAIFSLITLCITGFDNFTVVLESEGKQQLIYKHAISTVSPARPIDLKEWETPAP